ncbi:MAG: cupin domain-containing protein [Paludibacter sp.]|nr:cupin domain-containing protein [Paludibacter sp.]
MKHQITTSLLALFVSCISVFGQYNNGVIVEPVLKTDTTSIGQKIIYPQFNAPEVTMARITIKPGKSTGWHKHSFPVFAYILEGSLSIEIEKKPTVIFSAGQSFAEVMNTMHNGTNNSNKDVVLIAFFLGGKNMPLSTH